MRSILTFLLTISIMSTSLAQDRSYDDLWAQVEDLELQGLPKSALKILDSVAMKAEADKNSAQKIKVLIFRSKFALNLEEDARLKIISDFKREIEENEYPVRNFLHSLIADLYWRYFQENRWRFYDRTHTESKVDQEDFRTWDLKTIFEQIDHHFANSLNNGLQLKIDRVERFELLINLTEDSRIYRPSLFDFLAHRALEFYQSGETSITKPRFKFEIDDKTYLGTADTFSKLELRSEDSTSLQLKALKIYQDLTGFHLRDESPEALVDLNIHRLSFVRDKATFKEVEETVLKTLNEEIRNLAGQDAVSLYELEKARIFYEQGRRYDPEQNPEVRWKLREASGICENLISVYPETRAARNSKILLDRINQKSLRIQAETYVPLRSRSRILVTYANYKKLNIRIFPINRKDYLRLKRTFRPDEQFKLFKSLEPGYNWTALLKDESDFQTHSTELIIPELDNGFHLILVMPDPSDDRVFAFETLQSTDLALVQKPGHIPAVFQLIDRNTGSPRQGAKMDVTFRPYGDKSYSESRITDKKGQFRIKPAQNQDNISFKARFKNDVSYFDDLYVNPYRRSDREKDIANAFIFLDRSIYRPGQTVYFKAIAMKSDGIKSEVLSNQSFVAELRDVNNSILETLKLKSNEFGSINGSFVLPDQSLNGLYRISVGSESGRHQIRQTHYFSVEDYKRPKFKVEFDAVNESLRLNDSVRISGKAIAYSGPAVTAAKVNYRVSRQVDFPDWYYWYRPWFNSESQEIVQGETTTDKSGEFEINFIALPDRSVSEKNQPIFSYEIKVDVTDLNGETRSRSTIVKVGYHSMIATLELAEKMDKDLKDHKIKLQTVNLNDEIINASGQIKIYKLLAPDRVLRQRPWPAPDYQVIPEATFKAAFPHDAYKNEHDSKNWMRGELVFESEFNSEQSTEIKLGNIRRWESGLYVAELISKDSFGKTVTDRVRTTIFGLKDNVVADRQLLNVSTDKTSYQPGDEVRIKISSAAHKWVTVDIEKDHKVVRQEIIELNNNIKTISIPVDSEDLGGFAVLLSSASFNSYQSESLVIDVPYPSRELNIETLTFRDKLLPGQQETWSFKINGPKKDKIAAEMLAGMYDASLDHFKRHDWYFNPYPGTGYYAFSKRQATFSFGIKNFVIKQGFRGGRRFLNPVYDRLDWFGFDMFNPWRNEQYLYRLRRTRNIQNTGNISGMVMDEGGPLPGVNVIIKGSTSGTQTDFDGIYYIEAQKGETLEFSYAGYITKEVAVADSSTIDITLEADPALTWDVMATSRGISMGRKATGDANAPSVIEMAVEEEVADGIFLHKTSGNQEAGNILSADGGFEAVNLRTNFQETAFFYPELRTDEKGEISFEFTAPESLTQWKLQLLAHSADGKHATETLKAVTQKDLMVLPNPPRFIREGDSIVLSSKIANLTDSELAGRAVLQLFDAVSGKAVDTEFSNLESNKVFSVGPEGNTEVSWSLKVPFTGRALQYKIMAKSGRFSDGEQNVLPVLSNRMMVTETLPLWVGSGQSRTFTLNKLKNLNSESITHHRLTLEVTSNPVWYAVQAMPYLMEFPHDCNEQIFSRLYSNSLASSLVNKHPKIRTVFEQWRSSGVLKSNLEKNEELKSILIEETPWLRDAQNETEQKKRIALLFDLNRMSWEVKGAVRKLRRNQYPNGSWPWFEGGPENRYITQHIISGLGHLNQLEVEIDNVESMIENAIQYLDREFVTTYEDIRKYDKDVDLEADHLSYVQLHYLYTRSFFPEYEIPKRNQEIIDYYLNQIKQYWLKRNLYSKALMALVCHRNNRNPVAKQIVNSLKETSLDSDEMGMYWKSNTASWFWYSAPIETQALIIELFTEINEEQELIDKMKVWLLKNKQTNRWSSTKSTTEAIYALMLQGSDWLSVTEDLEIQIGSLELGDKTMDDYRSEAGTGYFKTSWGPSEIKPEMSSVTLKKKGEGIAWAGLYWQYFEDLDKISTAETPLKLKKRIFKKVNTDYGEELTEIDENNIIRLGDLLTVRIELSVDRPMEYVHMKDMRASGLEPVNVLSRHKWQDGLGYYESTKDAATHFFFDRLPKGVYIFEYDLRANNAGSFSNGITSIQSMYAPEFSSHSEGTRIMIN